MSVTATGNISYRGDVLTLQLARDGTNLFPPPLILRQVNAAAYDAAAMDFGDNTPMPAPTSTPRPIPTPTAVKHGHS